MRTEDQTGIEEKMTKTGMDKIKENIQILDKNKKHTAKCKIVFFNEIIITIEVITLPPSFNY
jgi:hypothetical protein